MRGSSQSALTLHSFRLTVSSYTCPQNASSNFTCFDYPSESQAASRDFVFNCVGSPSSCSVGLVQTDRCEEHESYCWGYRSYKPWCSSALTPSLECACTSTSCITGQCYSDDSNCPLAPLCPSDYTLCSDYHCVKDPSECPTILACPTSMVLCGDLKRCGVSKEDCDFVATASCPPHQPLLCADGFTCVSRYDLCPTAIRCPPGFVRCEGGTCRESVDDCVATIPCQRRHLLRRVASDLLLRRHLSARLRRHQRQAVHLAVQPRHAAALLVGSLPVDARDVSRRHLRHGAEAVSHAHAVSSRLRALLRHVVPRGRAFVPIVQGDVLASADPLLVGRVCATTRGLRFADDLSRKQADSVHGRVVRNQQHGLRRQPK